jgi:hypothetical protein
MPVSMSTESIFVRPGIKSLSLKAILFRVICTKCIDEFNPSCEICGEERHKTWDDFEGSDPLEDFMKWILKNFGKAHKTLIYAHYGVFYYLILNNNISFTGKI